MIIRKEIDATKYPLSNTLAQDLAKAGVKLFYNYHDKQWYLNRRYFEACPELLQEAFRWMIVGPPDHLEEAEKLVSEIEQQLAVEDKEAGHE